MVLHWLLLYVCGFRPFHERTRLRLQALDNFHLVVCNQSSAWYERWLLKFYCSSANLDVAHLTFYDIHHGIDGLRDTLEGVLARTTRSVVVVAAGVNYHPMVRTFHMAHRDYYYIYDIEKTWSLVCSALSTVYPLQQTCVQLTTPKPVHFSDLFVAGSKVSYKGVPQAWFVDLVKLSSCLMLVPLVCCLWAGLLDVFLGLLVVMVSALVYHDSYEQTLPNDRVVMMFLAAFLVRLVVLHSWDTVFSYGMACLSMVHLYIGSMTRRDTLHRTSNYTNYRSAMYSYMSLMLVWYAYNVDHGYF